MNSPLTQNRHSGGASSARSFGQDVFGTLLSNVSVFAFGFLSSVIVNRGLGASGKGAYATLLTAAGFASMFVSAGLGKSLAYHLALPDGLTQRYFKVALTLLVPQLALAGLGLLVMALWIIGPTGGNLLYREHLVTLILLAVMSIPNALASAGLRGLKRFSEGNRIGPATTIGFVGIVGCLWVAGRLTVDSALLAKTIAAAGGVALAVHYLTKAGVSWRPSFDTRACGSMLRYGAGYFAYSIFQNLAYRSDIFFINHIAGESAAGVYSTATGLAELMWHLPNAVGTVLFPIATSMDPDAADRLAARACRWSVLIVALGMLGMSLLAPLLVPILYGADFTAATSSLHWLAPGIVTNVVYQVLGARLASRRHLGALSTATIFGFVVNSGLNFLLVRDYAATGAALASTISYTATSVLTAWFFLRSSKLDWRATFLIPRDEVSIVLSSLRSRLHRTR